MHSLTSKVARLRYYVKRRGVLETTRFLATRLLRYHVTRVYEADLTKPLSSPVWSTGECLKVIGPETPSFELIPEIKSFLGGPGYELIEGVRDGDRLFVVGNGVECLHRGYIMFKSRTNRLIGEPAGVPSHRLLLHEPRVARKRSISPRFDGGDVLSQATWIQARRDRYSSEERGVPKGYRSSRFFVHPNGGCVDRFE